MNDITMLQIGPRGLSEGKRLVRMCWYDPDFGGALLPLSQVLARGWTKARIRKELGDPDCFGLNPRGGHLVALYSEKRVRRSELRVIRKEAEADDAV